MTDIQPQWFGGIGDLGASLAAPALIPSFAASVHIIAIIRDAGNNPRGASQSACPSLRNARLSPPRQAGKPYILHPIRVMLRMNSDLDRTVAILHDVIEDTPVTLESLRQQGYPQGVIEALECLTRRDGESYDRYLDRVETNPIAQRVKMADLEDNMDWRRLAGRSGTTGGWSGTGERWTG